MEPASVLPAGPPKDKPVQRNVDTLVSVCAVTPDKMEHLEEFVRETVGILDAAFAYYELLLIDNGTSIDVHNTVQQLQRVVPNVRMLRLSRNYPTEVAIAAALDHCVGDYVAVMDSVSHPPALIPEMVRRAMGGYDAVVAEPSASQRSLVERLISTPAYRIASNIMGFELRPEESYFRVFSRRLVNSLIKIRSKNRSLSCMHGLIGLRKCSISYTPVTAPVRQGAGKRVLRQLTLAADIVVSNSAIPLRFAACLGLLASAINLLYLFYIMAVTLVKSRIAEGWLTTSLMHTVMFLLMFLIMAILAEYVARILDETKEQPLYFIESETNSTVSATSQERLNIV
jgi:glycosyltransferase involved in cell wall biosynthesis